MIEFLNGPHGEKINDNQKSFITSVLKSCDNPYNFYHQINIAYNNVNHFCNQHNYNIHYLLKEIKNLAHDKHHKLVIMGSIHFDPFGHTSGLIGQFDDYKEYNNSIVKDSYVRFKVYINPNYSYKYKTLQDNVIYHFLLDVPEIIHLQLGRKIPVYMYTLYNSTGEALVFPDLYPKSKYKELQIYRI